MSTEHLPVWLLSLTAVISGVVAVQSSAGGQKSFLWKQCDEDAILLHVDPGPLARLLPENHSLALVEGKARVLIATQDCPAYWIDGEDIGAALEVHHWVAVKGLSDVRKVAGSVWHGIQDSTERNGPSGLSLSVNLQM